jgi:hypothetical protein
MTNGSEVVSRTSLLGSGASPGTTFSGLAPGDLRRLLVVATTRATVDGFHTAIGCTLHPRMGSTGEALGHWPHPTHGARLESTSDHTAAIRSWCSVRLNRAAVAATLFGS